MNLSTCWLLIALVAMGGWSMLHHKLFLAAPKQRWPVKPQVLEFILALDFYLITGLSAFGLHLFA